jgi:hypothetical protein
VSDIHIYQTPDNQIQIEVAFENDTVWLNRQHLATLFDRDVKTIGKHINNVFSEGELDKDSVVANFATTASDGKTYQTEHYNLDVIISVGYRVKSQRGTQFRQWANCQNQDLQDYRINEMTMQRTNPENLKIKRILILTSRFI